MLYFLFPAKEEFRIHSIKGDIRNIFTSHFYPNFISWVGKVLITVVGLQNDVFTLGVNYLTVWFDSSVPVRGEVVGLSHAEPGGGDGHEEAVREDRGAELALSYALSGEGRVTEGKRRDKY